MNIGKRGSWLAGAVIVVAALAAYANTFHAPFTFDDVSSIGDNPSILHLWPLSGPLSPPMGWGFSVSGRPLLNLTLAINYAISGFDVWSYHLLNLVIHIFAGLTLFGIVRRTLLRSVGACEGFVGAQACGALGDERSKPAPLQTDAIPNALAVALLWTLHPLQTESVTYIIQRAESLMGLCFLLTLYGFIRGVDCHLVGANGNARPVSSGRLRHLLSHKILGGGRGIWFALSVLACLLGMACKEVTAIAPVLVLLYDRSFVAGSFRDAWKQRRGFYLALAATWLPLAWLLAGMGGNRGGTMGFNAGISWSGYWLTQFEAVTRYLRLAFWPHPLVFDYGRVLVRSWAEVWWQAIVVLALLGLTIWALVKKPRCGFLGAWFFAILAPTSIVPGAIQMIVEHRMYLSLAAVIALVLGVASLRFNPRLVAGAGAVLALAAGAVTWQRNAVYGSERTLWEDTVTRRPANARAQNNLGLSYYHLGRVDDAIAHYRESLRLDPTVANTHYNLGLAFMHSGRLAEAVAPFEEAVRILPYYFYAHQNLGIVLTKLGRPQEALAHFAEALRFDPSPAETHLHFGVTLAELGRWREAADHYAQAVHLNPRHAEAQANWGVALFHLNSGAAAIEHFDEALRLKPDSPDVHFNLGLALASLGRTADAVAHYAEAVRLNPAHPEAQLNLGIALGQAGRLAEAIEQLEQAVRLRPDWPEAHTNFATALLQTGRVPEALSHYEAALRLRPDDARAHYNVGYALLASGRGLEARQQFESALQIQPDLAVARDLLRRLQQTEPVAR